MSPLHYQQCRICFGLAPTATSRSLTSCGASQTLVRPIVSFSAPSITMLTHPRSNSIPLPAGHPAGRDRRKGHVRSRARARILHPRDQHHIRRDDPPARRHPPARPPQTRQAARRRARGRAVGRGHERRVRRRLRSRVAGEDDGACGERGGRAYAHGCGWS